MRSAVIDLGSNTFHLLVAHVDQHGLRNVVRRHSLATRIGERALAERVIPEDAYAPGLDAIAELVARAGGCAPRIVATGVFREAANARAFLAEAEQRTHTRIEILDAFEEARLTWLAVSVELAGSHGRLAVIDLGGGTLELAYGTRAVDVAHSLPLGVLRLRGLSGDDVRAQVAALACQTARELRAAETVAISSGTARALLRVARRLRLVTDEQRHVWRRTLGELARTLATQTPAQLAELGVPASRADTIAIGAAVLHTVLEQLGRPVVYVARAALREGALIDLARQSAWQPRAMRRGGVEQEVQQR